MREPTFASLVRGRLYGLHQVAALAAGLKQLTTRMSVRRAFTRLPIIEPAALAPLASYEVIRERARGVPQSCLVASGGRTRAPGDEQGRGAHARAAPLALLATIRAWRTGSGVRALRTAWRTTSAAIAGLVRHPACTATGRT